MTKKELRLNYTLKRALLTEEEKTFYAKKIISDFFDFLQPLKKTISIYLPILSKNEINTYLFFSEKDSLKNTIVAPKWNTLTNELTHHPITLSSLSISKSGITEPIDSSIINPERLDIIVIPLLYVDKKGYRVGYGKGVYDTFLKNQSNNTLFVGLHYFEIDHNEDIETDDWDIAIDICFTPKNQIIFNEHKLKRYFNLKAR
jgi:5-formyltetrahydrofolate cyclo-ligase